jgi:large subunit ribosomal protein L19
VAKKMNNLKKYAELINPMKKDVPPFRPGDIIRVIVKLKEEEGERNQAFEGIVTRRKSCGLDETFTVRKVSYGIGVERIFHLHAPNIMKIEVVKPGSVRRAKLYYLRNKIGKAAQVDELKQQEPTVTTAAAAPIAAAPQAEPK